ncbi:MAG: PAS domain S-box protein [Acidobacteria bacterium]|nr:PAS domain S-box protein [Acidobacteriota bacterium]MBU4254771.1 PAS domain S-box protein [Acidobacteriota bacterium]MBU4494448.1 PAS domain S-box protein [Acidobacteriota bacterium]MCG2816642.1 ATP-binding protein [Candidatus Aminicenantes bacterium]
MSIKWRLSTIIILIGFMLFLITGFMLWTQFMSLDQGAGPAVLTPSSLADSLAETTSLWKQGIQVLALICLLILLISYRLLSTIIRSIDILKKGAETIGKGRFEYRIPMDAKDELGQLAKTFNEMTGNLERTTISRDYVDNIVRSMHGSLIVTSPERYIQTVNASTCKMLGYSEQELRGMPLETIFADESSLLQKNFDELLQKGFVQYVESGYRTKKGEIIPILFSASLMRGEDGENLGMVVVSADITERKDAEKKQSRLLKELDSVNKELKDFAYIVSHDLKAPLRGIQSLATWIEEDYRDKLDLNGQKQLDLLKSRVVRMQGLINGILHYSRVGRTKEEKVEVNLHQLVGEIIDSISPPPGISVTVDTPLPVLHCERTRIGQLFQNLISNAVKYMDKEQGWVRVGCREKPDVWQFSVSDNGPGIEEKYFEKIFQIFQTLQSRDDVEGTGIGLAVVKKVVEMYGGEIWLESELKQGTTFFFTLSKESGRVEENET